MPQLVDFLCYRKLKLLDSTFRMPDEKVYNLAYSD